MAESTICKKTGLRLLPAVGQEAWRLAKTSFGPLNPPARPADGDRGEWGRYDVAEHRTVYSATPACAAYAESLASLRPGFSQIVGEHRVRLRTRDLFDDDSDDGRTLDEIVETEWAERHHMPAGSVDLRWRDARKLYKVTMPRQGWFIDIEASDSVAALAKHLGCDLAPLGIEYLTVGDLRGTSRPVTTTIAAWLWHQVLEDGSVPHGIRFGSKHGNDWTCWAIWLRAVDDGKELISEPTTADDGRCIEARYQNDDLDRIVRLFGLKSH